MTPRRAIARGRAAPPASKPAPVITLVDDEEEHASSLFVKHEAEPSEGSESSGALPDLQPQLAVTHTKLDNHST